jgi:hypothetical protein
MRLWDPSPEFDYSRLSLITGAGGGTQTDKITERNLTAVVRKVVFLASPY